MIRLAKKNGEYVLQERTYKVVKKRTGLLAFIFPREDDIEIVYSDWVTAETIDLDKEDKNEKTDR